MPVHLTCSGCGATYTRVPALAATSRYCSNRCYWARVPQDAPEISPDGTTARLPIRRRDDSIRAYVTVDADDAAWVNQWTWRLVGGYAGRVTHEDSRVVHVFLHRELLGLPRITDGREGDHRDRDRMNCRRSNLRIAPKGKNQQNKSSHRGATSGYRGVHLHKRTGLWVAAICVERKRHHLGYFRSEHEAGAVAREARLRLMSHAVD